MAKLVEPAGGLFMVGNWLRTLYPPCPELDTVLQLLRVPEEHELLQMAEILGFYQDTPKKRLRVSRLWQRRERYRLVNILANLWVMEGVPSRVPLKLWQRLAELVQRERSLPLESVARLGVVKALHLPPEEAFSVVLDLPVQQVGEGAVQVKHQRVTFTPAPVSVSVDGVRMQVIRGAEDMCRRLTEDQLRQAIEADGTVLEVEGVAVTPACALFLLARSAG